DEFQTVPFKPIKPEKAKCTQDGCKLNVSEKSKTKMFCLKHSKEQETEKKNVGENGVILLCQTVLKTGNNKNKPCNKPCCVESASMCGTHYKRFLKDEAKKGDGSEEKK